GLGLSAGDVFSEEPVEQVGHGRGRSSRRALALRILTGDDLAEDLFGLGPRQGRRNRAELADREPLLLTPTGPIDANERLGTGRFDPEPEPLDLAIPNVSPDRSRLGRVDRFLCQFCHSPFPSSKLSNMTMRNGE